MPVVSSAPANDQVSDTMSDLRVRLPWWLTDAFLCRGDGCKEGFRAIMGRWGRKGSTSVGKHLQERI